MRLRGGSRPVRGSGRRGWRPVRGQRFGFLGSQPGPAVLTQTSATGKGEGRSTGRPLTGALLDLAIEGVNPEDFELSSGPDEVISPMAAAFQRAQRTRREPNRSESTKPERRMTQQEEILSRTMQQLQSQQDK